jgi:NADH:ubiquinone oxidoreductase subunit K
MVMTYFIILALLFLTALIFSGDITGIMTNYFDPEVYNPDKIIWFVVIGALLFSLCSTGLILQSFRRRGGFYLFFSTALVILALDLIFLNFDWLRYLIHSGLMFLAGVVHFSKRCYTGKPDKIHPDKNPVIN